MENKPLDTIQAEAEAKVRALRQAAEEEAEARRREYQEKLDNIGRVAKASEARSAAEKECETLQSDVSRAQAELKGLGLFAGKRKRELKEAIDALTGKLQSAQARVKQLQEQEAQLLAAIRKAPENLTLPDKKELIYQCAGVYVQYKLYARAASEYCKLRGYKDVDDILRYNAEIRAVLDQVRFDAGNTVSFGRFDWRGCGDMNDIEWLVLANDGETATLIARHRLAKKPFNEALADVTWETCSLRKWLNGEFLDKAFDEGERACLAETTVTADANPTYDTDPGRETRDRVFLLSAREVERYFAADEDRICMDGPGEYYGNTGRVGWWLRSPGVDGSKAALVDRNGRINAHGADVAPCDQVVRPVITVRLSEIAAQSNRNQKATMVFGRYPQGTDASDGPSPIEWLVLARDGGTATLIARQSLERKPFDDEDENATWETCSLRRWLNGEFLNAAFTDGERAKLATVSVPADRNPVYPFDPGNETRDRVFLLSIREADDFFRSDDDRICFPTARAVAQGASVNDYGAGEWWTRSPGGEADRHSYLSFDGSINVYGYFRTYDKFAVRPVIVLKLSE